MRRHDERPGWSVDENRRWLVRGLALGAAGLWVPGAFAGELVRTPHQTEGPFYPNRLPLDTDNDLLVINDGITPAVGTITWFGGRILDARGEPVRNALVEIWQCDNNGVYLHPGSENGAKRDGNFQGFGRFITGSKGEYGFRTIKPVPYPGRTPHIHFRVTGRGFQDLVTQMYVEAEPGNARDGLYASLDPHERAAVTVRLERATDGKALATRFEIVVRT